MKSKKYLRRRRTKRNKTIKRKKYLKSKKRHLKGGFKADTIDYKDPVLNMYSEDYMEKTYLNQDPQTN